MTSGPPLWEELAAAAWEEPGAVFERVRRDTVGRVAPASDPSTGAIVVILFLVALMWSGRR